MDKITVQLEDCVSGGLSKQDHRAVIQFFQLDVSLLKYMVGLMFIVPHAGSN
jgi:hypothetical protein